MDTKRPVIKRLNGALFARLSGLASSSPRLRTAFDFHDSATDPVQRFLNVMQPGTYVRPHRHEGAASWEMTVALAGRIAVLLLEADGTVRERIELDALGPEHGIELPAGEWHTSAVLSPDTVLLEIKCGPYEAASDKEFASWSPPEGALECVDIERRIRLAQPGESLAVYTTTPPSGRIPA